MKIEGETIGVIHVQSYCLDAYSQEDIDLLSALANVAVIAIENARLFEQVQAGRERLRRLTQQVVSAQEEERHRLSRELHDEAGQALTALKISLDLIQSDLPVETGSLRQRLGEAVALTETTMEQIRLLAYGLRPPALDAVGLNYTLEGLCRDFAERTQLSIDYAGAELPALPEAANICLYRFLQEALTNVAKHAHANHVRVAVRCDAETISLSVEDDGQGFEVQAKALAGIGLLGMQERIELLGGRLEIESWLGQGTRLTAYIPL
jgi:signal transduction histidine kinase